MHFQGSTQIEQMYLWEKTIANSWRLFETIHGQTLAFYLIVNPEENEQNTTIYHQLYYLCTVTNAEPQPVVFLRQKLFTHLEIEWEATTRPPRHV